MEAADVTRDHTCVVGSRDRGDHQIDCRCRLPCPPAGGEKLKDTPGFSLHGVAVLHQVRIRIVGKIVQHAFLSFTSFFSSFYPLRSGVLFFNDKFRNLAP